MTEFKNQLDALADLFGIERWEMTPFYEFLFEELDDNEFRREVLTLITFGMNLDSAKLKEIPSKREEGNVITAYCFRNTILEDVHASTPNRILDNTTMKELMIESSNKVTNWLKMRDALKDSAPGIYFLLVNIYQEMFTRNWDKGK